MANETVFLVICCDRHTNDAITVHRTREGADAEIEAFKASYVGMGREYRWKERKYGRGSGWLRYVDTEDEGPSARIQRSEVKP